MNYLKLGSAITLTAIVAVGFAGQRRGPLTAAGPVRSETRHIPAFDRIVAGQVFHIMLRVGEKPSLVLHAPENLLPHIQVRVSGHTLTLSCDTGFRTESDNTVNVDVTTPDLVAANISGVGSLDIRGLVRGPRFMGEASGAATILMDANVDAFRLQESGAARVKMGSLKAKSVEFSGSGASQFTVAGNADATRIGVDGSCFFRGDRFETRHAEINSNGACNTEIRVSDSLRAKAGGASHIKYLGRPKVTKDVSGVASISG